MKITQKRPAIDYSYHWHETTINKDNGIAYTFDSKTGQECLNRSGYKSLFFKMATHYCPQQHITTCGIASATIVLNTMYSINKWNKPISRKSLLHIAELDFDLANYSWDENNFFDVAPHMFKIVTGQELSDGEVRPGIELMTLTKTIKEHNIPVDAKQIISVDETGIDEFRSLVKQVTGALGSKYMIANFSLSTLIPSINNGHFAPVAAYDEVGDYVLLLDPWVAFAGWLWIKLTELYKSMNTKDNDEYRGYILISNRKKLKQ